jgi:hypothetical protein
MAKFFSAIGGAALIGAGLISLSMWGWRGFHPNAADRARIATIAEYGGGEATAPADSKKILLLGGVVALSAGGALLASSRRK